MEVRVSATALSLRIISRIISPFLYTPGQGQILRAKDDKALDRLQRHIRNLPRTGQAVEHSIERNFHLQACQGSAQTEVDATPEAQMPVRLALNVKTIFPWQIEVLTVLNLYVSTRHR